MLLAHISTAAPFYFAGALIAVANAVLIWTSLPETLSEEHRLHPAEPAPIGEVFAGGRGTFIVLLLLASLISTTGVRFHSTCSSRSSVRITSAGRCGGTSATPSPTRRIYRRAGAGRSCCGGWLKKNIEEKELAITGGVLLALSLWLLPRVPPGSAGVAQFFAVSGLLALGNGLLVPTLSGMSSRHVHGRAQGRVLGLMASAGSLGRFLGPILAVLPLPALFSEMSRPLVPVQFEQVNTGYVTAFTWSAWLVVIATVCLLLLRVPKDAPEEGAVLADPA